MSNTIRKLRPSDYWRIGEHESWFGDMAAEGLHLKEIGKLFAVFEKGEPRETKYRIDITKNGIPEEQKSLYKEYGWDYVTGYGKFSIFSSPESLHAAELHTDPEEQSYTLRTLDRELKRNTGIIAILVALIFVLVGSALFIGGTFFLNLVQGQVLQQCILLVVESYVLYTTLLSSRSISRLRKTLSEGKPIDHRANWRKGLWRGNAIGILFVIVGAFCVALPFITIALNETSALPEGETNLPIVRLAAMENSRDYARKTGYMFDDIDYGNSLRYSWNVLAPIQYETSEQGEIKNKMWADNSGTYSPSIRTQYFKLAFAGIAGGLIQDLMKRHLYEENQIPQRIESLKFDNLYIVENAESKQVFASVGKQVIYMRYYGYGDINQLVDLLSERLVGAE